MPLELRPTTAADLEFVERVERAPEAAPFLMRYRRGRHLRALEDAEVEHLVIVEGERRHGFVLIAGIGNEHRSLELRRIAVAEPGRGIGREAIELALARCFEAHGAHRVWLDLKPHNERARRVYEALGFVAEGIARESVLSEGGFESMLIMSLLEPEWRARRGGAGPAG